VATAEEWYAKLRDALVIKDPEWDVSPGTPESKIIEAVAAELAGVFNDGVLGGHLPDPDKVVGKDLDNLVGRYGFVRGRGRRAIGVVTFSRGKPATQNHRIRAGTQVYVPAADADGKGPIYFQTTNAGVIENGGTSADVPVEAVVAGSRGNVAAGRIKAIASRVAGVSTVINQLALTGGRDVESDEELRKRFKETVFRNLAGTEDFFLGLCYRDSYVSRAIVIGAVERWRETLEVTGTTLTSRIPGEKSLASSLVLPAESKYSFPAGGEHFGHDLGGSAEDVADRGTDYTYAVGSGPNFRPTITILDTDTYGVGDFVDLEHEYMPSASRNNPPNEMDKVDIFVKGEYAVEVTEEREMKKSTAHTFGDGTGGTLDRTKWLRDDGLKRPTSGNYFMRLTKDPVISIPDEITYDGVTYLKDQDYWLVRDDSDRRYSHRARDGIEWRSTANGAGTPPNGAEIGGGEFVTIPEYLYNALIERLDEEIQMARLIGIDTLVHRARYARLRFNLAWMATEGAQTTATEAAAETAVTEWLQSKGFKDGVQIADLFDVLGGVKGIDNVRLLKSNERDNAKQQIQVTGGNGTFRLRVEDQERSSYLTDEITFTKTDSDPTVIAAIEDALTALPFIDGADIEVTRPKPTRINVRFVGSNWGNRPVKLMGFVEGTTSGNVIPKVYGAGAGIEWLAEDGKTVIDTYYGDFRLNSDTVPVMHKVVLKQRAQNTFE
jgi:hypothetical protein